ncbi:hypothetical protein B0H14DRAFT_2689671 [Mycena olivaceomarginata]|nr:hypothetical protein B0H14DRAFT_2689671 [Mycena olivaceomarginata]
MYFKFLAFFGLAFLLSNVWPAVGKETNASRMKRGLPPLPPRFLARNKRPTPSATISAPYKPLHTPRPQGRSSRIQVFAGNGSSLGYVNNSTPIFGINLDADRGHDLRVQPVTGKRTVEQFSIHFERSNHLSAPLDSGTLASNKLLLRDLTELPNMNQDRAAVSDKNFVRTAVWSIDSKAKTNHLKKNELKALYVDPDDTESPIFVFDAAGNKFHFLEDIDSINNDFPMIPVRFYLSED